MKNTLDFLTELNSNNNTEWFHANRKKYDIAKSEFINYVEELITELASFDKRISGVQPKQCLFRINRDIRFSKDKSPYKNNFGAYMAQGGRKSPLAGYYLHLQPGSCFLAGGIWMPQPDALLLLRKEIYYNIKKFKGIIENKKLTKYFKSIEGEKNVKAPNGFDKNFEDIDLIKFKSYTLMHSITDKDVLHIDFKKKCKEVFEAMYEFNSFLNSTFD